MILGGTRLREGQEFALGYTAEAKIYYITFCDVRLCSSLAVWNQTSSFPSVDHFSSSVEGGSGIMVLVSSSSPKQILSLRNKCKQCTWEVISGSRDEGGESYTGKGRQPICTRYKSKQLLWAPRTLSRRGSSEEQAGVLHRTATPGARELEYESTSTQLSWVEGRSRNDDSPAILASPPGQENILRPTCPGELPIHISGCFLRYPVALIGKDSLFHMHLHQYPLPTLLNFHGIREMMYWDSWWDSKPCPHHLSWGLRFPYPCFGS